MDTIDTSVFINAVEPHEADHQASRRFLGALRTQQIPIIVPTLVLAEIAGTVSRLRTATRAERLVAVLLRLPHLTFVPLDAPLAQQAAALAAAHRLLGRHCAGTPSHQCACDVGPVRLHTRGVSARRPSARLVGYSAKLYGHGGASGSAQPGGG